jgi:hypothetical protein
MDREEPTRRDALNALRRLSGERESGEIRAVGGFGMPAVTTPTLDIEILGRYLQGVDRDVQEMADRCVRLAEAATSEANSQEMTKYSPFKSERLKGKAAAYRHVARALRDLAGA